MPFPWKKAKVTRITRMVADLQSPKRGGSLVVETGFPTSLIDLFVKNRDKLRRPSVRRKKKKSVYADEDLCIGAPVMVDERVVVSAGPEIAETKVIPEPERELAAEAVVTETPVTAEEEKTDKRRAVESYFLAAVRVFVVTTLALSTKKLAIGVTLSAFFLLFLEFVGKGVIVLLVRRFRSEKGGDHDEDDEEEFVAVRDLVNLRSSSEEVEFSTGPSSTLNSRSSGEETGGTSTVNSRDDEFFRPQLEILSRGRKWGSPESGSEEAVPVPALEKTKSKRSKIRRKIIKNIVPKTLRKSKRWKKLKSSKISEEEREEHGELEEEEEAQEISDGQEVEEVELSVLAEEDEAEAEEEEEAMTGREASWVAAATLVVVLLGLFGGKVLSVLLTLIWCLAMKVVGIGTRPERPSS